MAEYIATLHPDTAIEIPAHLTEFAHTSTQLLRRAHEGSLLIADASIRVMYSGEAHRVYIEHEEQATLYDYELLAVHMGRSSLSVSLEHRHPKTAFSEAENNRTSVVFEGGQARTYASSLVSGVLNREIITENEDAGYELTQRLQHAMSIIGIREFREEHPYSQAS